MTATLMVLAVAVVQVSTPVEQGGVAPSGEILTLAQVLDLAEQRNLDLKVAEARLEQANLISRRVWAGYLPTATFGGGYTRNIPDVTLTLPMGTYIREVPAGALPAGTNGPAFDPSQPISLTNPPGVPSDTLLAFPGNPEDIVILDKDQWVWQGQVTQPLLVPALWGGIANAYRAEKVAELSVEVARREILFGVTQLYFGAVTTKGAVGVRSRALEVARDHERDAQVRVDAGAMPRIALVRAQIDRVRAEQDLRQAENGYAGLKISLATMLDRPDSGFDVAEPIAPVAPSGSPDELQQAALRDRPDVQAARTSAEVARGNETVTWLKYLPNVIAQGTWRWMNVEGFAGRKDAWALSVLASWTIWDGGLREVELAENEAKVVEARAAERSAENRAKDEVRRAVLDLESARANAIKAGEQLTLAKENMQLVEVNFESGVATQLEVADASTQLVGAEFAALSERLSAEIAALRLLKAAGAFNP